VADHFAVGATVGAPGPKPLEGVRILALEQMQALPYATQLLGRLGADVVKVESPQGGDLGRSSLPAMKDPEGRNVGATFLRNNLSKRSIAIDLKSPAGRQLVIDLAPRFDVVCENFRAGAIERLGLGFDDLVAVHPTVIYCSLSGFGHAFDGGPPSPYGEWPALAAVVEAMSGIYEMKRTPGRPPTVSPMGALGDISTALFSAIGVLCALRLRDATGKPQRIDVAMFDVLVAMTDIVVNFSSLGMKGTMAGVGIMDGFEANDGWFILQVIREHQWASLCNVIGKPEWIEDPRFADRKSWTELLESDIRAGVEAWSKGHTRLECCEILAANGLISGPCFTDDEVINDPHLAERHMIVAMERTDGISEPVLSPGNPIKLAGVPEGPERRVPWLGEDTDEILEGELGMDAGAIASLRAQGVIG
jgi:crotonobetainyl-CoA:carnitine CoA-transferase CaiB-like acyl-CoA transferase